MKRFVFVVVVGLMVCASLSAQQASFLNFDRAVQPAFLTAASPDTTPDTALVPSLTLPTAPAFFSAAIPSAALPAAPPPPPVRGDLETRWDLAGGYEYVHFTSKPFSANLSGVHTSVAYAINEWFAAEGSVVAAFGGDVFQPGETAKYVLFTGGGRILWNRQPRRFSPWAHILVGGAHVNPQIAGSSKNGFALQTGAGVDYFFNPRMSFRGEADYVRSQLYSDSQNNFQVGLGVVLHF